MQDRHSGGHYYLQVGHLPPILAGALLRLTQAPIDPHARITGDGRALETGLKHRADVELLGRDIAPLPGSLAA